MSVFFDKMRKSHLIQFNPMTLLACISASSNFGKFQRLFVPVDIFNNSLNQSDGEIFLVASFFGGDFGYLLQLLADFGFLLEHGALARQCSISNRCNS